MDALLSADFLKFFLPLAGAVIGWLMNERRKRQAEEYLRKEERYRALLLSIRGFYAGGESPKLKQEFIDQLALSWLYCSDEVINRANAMVSTLKAESKADAQTKEAAFAALIGSIRKDLISRSVVRKTRLTGKEFERLWVVAPPA